MTVSRLTRRGALIAPLALAGCETIDGWFATKKDPLPGKRESLTELRRGFNADPAAPKVVLPPRTANASWPQAGGNPAHLMGHLEAAETLKPLWTADLGEPGGKRRKILAQPVVMDGVVYAMDSDATISAFRLAGGTRLWRTRTVNEDLDSSNVGGGLCWDSGTLFAVNGMAELLALDPAKGTVKWRKSLGVPVRSAPTVAGGRVYLTAANSKLYAFAAADGKELWSYQATEAVTTILGNPAPAVSQDVVVAGFGSGEVAALRADSGALIWTDGLGIVGGRPSLAEFQAIRGEPVIANGQIYVAGLGGLTIAADLLTGRRVWEKRVASANAPYVAGNWLFLMTTEQEMGAINLDDARIAWVAALPRWEKPDKKKDIITWYGPLLAGGRLIVLGSNGDALSLNPLTGAFLGKQPLSDVPSPIAPIAAEGVVLIVTEDGKLTAFK